MWMLIAGQARANPELDAVVHALSSRDPVSCEALEALTPTPTATLLEVVDTVQMPPWAPMRAADCLVEHHATEIRDHLDRWVTDPALAGLNRLVLGKLDAMPVEVAVPVAQKALTGTDPELARTRIAASKVDAVRAVAPAAPVAPVTP